MFCSFKKSIHELNNEKQHVNKKKFSSVLSAEEVVEIMFYDVLTPL